MKIFLILLFSLNLFALTAGPNNAGTGADNSAVGTLTWTNPGNITLADGVYATATSSAGNNTHYLQGSNYGFSIPAGATINGITVNINGHKNGTGGGSYFSNIVELVKGGVIGGNNNASNQQLSNPSDSVQTFGSVSDLWGQSWTATDINASNFGVVASYQSATNTSSVSIDYIQVTITYTAASSINGQMFQLFD